MKTNCCCGALVTDPAACGCCQGVEPLTPLALVNRPGLPALSSRIGTHATFLETMQARLSSSDFPSLARLTSRAADDPALALLDAWATVGDVLTFYQERIANEGYLRTATERRSVLELARLVGYQPRPGVAASVYLAYTIEPNYAQETVIPAGSRSQSIPGPGESAQSFETSEDLRARAQWNNLRPRMTQPQTPQSISQGDGKNAWIYLKGVSTNLKPNDPLLIDFLGTDQPEFFRVEKVVPNTAADRTLVTLQAKASKTPPSPVSPTLGLIEALTLPPSVQLANSLRLERNLTALFLGSRTAQDIPGLSFTSTARSAPPSVLLRKTLAGGEASHAALKAFAPALHKTLAAAATNAQVTEENPIKVYALRVTASLFGHNAPRRILQLEKDTGKILKTGEWPIIEFGREEEIHHEAENIIYLNASYEKILPETWVVIDTNGVDKPAQVIPAQHPLLMTQIKNVQANISRAEYGVTADTTRLEVTNAWIEFKTDRNEDSQVLADRDFQLIRGTVIYTQSEELELTEEPINDSICGDEKEIIELDDFYPDLEAGRWVIVSGEREIAGTSGVRFSELAMLSSVTQDVQLRHNTAGPNGTTPLPLAGDKTHSFIKLANTLAYCFKRDTVAIYGNVVKASHGETRKEVLGSGDGAKARQSFTLKQPPLTYVSASNPSGVDSTLKVYVNDVEWHESNTLLGLSDKDRRFVTQTDDAGQTAVIFGNGTEGARLPSGVENVRAVSRNGIGKGGNVQAEQISLLSTRPLGAKEVINPLPASGGADKETRDQARKNAPLAMMALDRLVSVQDYEDFARVFAGIGKARATELSDGRRQIVHLTIAGADDIRIETHSDLYRNLTAALRRFGDPYQAFRIDLRELKLLVLSARVRLHPDYLWEQVEPRIRAALLDTFSFERRALGQDAFLSEALSAMHRATGVTYVDVDTFGGVSEKIADSPRGVRRLRTPAEIADEVQAIVDLSGSQGPTQRVSVNLADFERLNLHPAQLAYLSPLVPATLILNEVPR